MDIFHIFLKLTVMTLKSLKIIIILLFLNTDTCILLSIMPYECFTNVLPICKRRRPIWRFCFCFFFIIVTIDINIHSTL